MCDNCISLYMLILLFNTYQSLAFKMTFSEQTMNVGEKYKFSLNYAKPMGARFDVYTMENLENPNLKSSKIGFPVFNTSTVYSPHYFRTDQYISLRSQQDVENQAVNIDLVNEKIQVGDEGVLNHSTIYFVLKSVSNSSIKVVILPVKINRAQVESCSLRKSKQIETKKNEKIVSYIWMGKANGCNKDIENFSIMIDVDYYLFVDDVIINIDKNELRYYINGSRLYFKMSVVPIFTEIEVIIFYKPKNESLISGSKYVKNLLYYSWVEWNQGNRVWSKRMDHESCFLHDKGESKAVNSFKIYNLDNGACIKLNINDFYESIDNDCPNYLNLPYNVKHECGNCMEVLKISSNMRIKAKNCKKVNWEKTKEIIISETHIRGYNESGVTGFKGLRIPVQNLISDKEYDRYERVYDNSYGISYGAVVEELKNERQNCNLITLIFIGTGKRIICTSQCDRIQVPCYLKNGNVITVLAIPTKTKSLLGYDDNLFCLYGKTTNGLVFVFNIKTRKTIIIKQKNIESIMPALAKSQVIDRDSLHEERLSDDPAKPLSRMSPFGMYSETETKHNMLFPAYQNHEKVSQTFEMAMKSCKEIYLYNKNIVSGEFHIKSADVEDYHGRVFCDRGWTVVFDYYHNYTTDYPDISAENIFDIALSNYTKYPIPGALNELNIKMKVEKLKYVCEALEPKSIKIEIETLATDNESELWRYFLGRSGILKDNTCWQYKLGDDHTSDLGTDCNNFQFGLSCCFNKRIIRGVFKQNELLVDVLNDPQSCGEETKHGHWTLYVI